MMIFYTYHYVTMPYKYCGVIAHAECVTPLIHLFKAEGNRCLAACDSRFYKQETIMVIETYMYTSPYII